ncbi:MAG: ATP-binding cassette domain-containing protein [Opitutales bacterium]|nr:ATP-binding cassette domain-containing protein [Opitutales bacterium]NRA26051.1 ATP-binding cassette domain-containing protein [Opitutales bacterium]
MLLGPNGSGKTTLLSMLNGMAAPSRGSLICFGQKYGQSNWNRVKEQIGMVSARVHHFIEPNQPVKWVVLSGRYAQINFWGEERRDELEEVRELLEAWGIDGYGDEPFGQISQGERQRCLICRALMAKPRLLILDEPCAGLDPVAREHFLKDIDALAKDIKGPTLLLVTHHVEEIRGCFQQALLLSKGRQIAAGPIGETVTSAPLSEMFGQSVEVEGVAGNLRLNVG